MSKGIWTTTRWNSYCAAKMAEKHPEYTRAQVVKAVMEANKISYGRANKAMNRAVFSLQFPGHERFVVGKRKA